MNLKKILLATAVALTASTSASALTLTAVTPTDLTPASEAQFAVGAFTGNLAFTLNSAANFPTSTPMRLTVTLPAGVKYKTQVAAADAALAGAGTVTVASGGGVGSSTVTFLVTATAAFNSVTVTSDVFVDGCTGLAATELKVDLVIDASGTAVDGGTVSTSAAATPTAPAVAGPVNACKDAFKVTIAKAATTPTLSLATGYKAFGAAPGTLGADFGTYIVATDTTAHRDFAKTPAAAADVSSIDFTVNAADGSVFKEVNTGGQTDAFSGNSAVVAGATNGATSTAIQLELKDNTSVKTAQAAATVTAAKLNLVTANGYAATKTVADATISPMVRQVSAGGTFDWTSEEGANSVFRITGLSAPTTMTVTSSNSNKGVNQSWSGTVTPVNGEVVVSSLSGLGISATGYGRADLTFEFESTGGVDVDRLIVQAGDIFELQSVTD